MGTFFLHFKALLRKNFLLFKRSAYCSTLEIIIPGLFVLLLVLVRKLIDPINLPQTSYVNNTTVFYPEYQPNPYFNISTYPNISIPPNFSIPNLNPNASQSTKVNLIYKGILTNNHFR